MDKKDIAAKLVLDVLNINLENPGKCQNAIYLAQVAGVKMGFFYRWECGSKVRSISHEDNFPQFEDTYHKLSMNEISGSYNDELNGCFLDEESTKKLKELKPLIDSTENLELLVSTHFLITRSGIKSKKQIIKTFKEDKYKMPENFELEIISPLIKYSLIDEKEIKK
jgi:hypothetical protein